MAIVLYKHNQIAYENAITMLENCGKAAVIHPTGTGKSFIAFKLCEDNPDKRICWLSPSEYIFTTQIENLRKTAGGYSPENISFFTYARLMNMEACEVDEIKPDYIVLDEFHRCGAEMWGRGVDKLIERYSDVPILGLSATAIRYLDNCRDMSDKLFGGNVASEITLGEAVVRGILNPPKYVLSMFSLQSELASYEKRLNGKKSKIVRDEGQKYLEALRRALEHAEGLDEVFYNHMPDKCGKYIVFCAGYEHMQDMISISKEWFCRVDSAPHIYSVYSDSPDTSKDFLSFKEDNSNHLKLLYCIDMLNEGIHVDNVAGVILLRPTVSPIVYKQQIGRALSADRKCESVIFDIVFNVENLYSIGELNDEIQLTTAYYRSLGEGGLVVNEGFRVIDEVHECVELFDKLENVLTASWDLMYECAVKYFDEHGDLEVPARYFSPEGYSLGRWIHNQRCVKNGQISGSLTEVQVEKLDRIGMRWELYSDYSWSRNFRAAEEYFNKFGNLDVACKYVTKDGVRLGEWLSNLRTWEKGGLHPKYLTPKRKRELEEIGMIWSKFDYVWEKNFSAAIEFYRENGNLVVPSDYVCKDGTRLGAWICRMRKLKGGSAAGAKLTAEQVRRLDDIGMVWEVNITRRWNDAYALAKEYFEENGNLRVPSSYRCKSGFTLGQWIKCQRMAFSDGKLDSARITLLNRIGMEWNPPDPWHAKFDIVKEYYKEHGNVRIKRDEVVGNVWIGKWLAAQKKLYNSGQKLTAEQRGLLGEIGF